MIDHYRSPDIIWSEFLQKFIKMKYDEEEETSTILEYTKEAKTYLVNWRNDNLNKIPKDKQHAKELSRFSKMTDYVTRISLFFQMVRWTCGDSGKSEVDKTSVKNAIELMSWLEDSFIRTMSEMKPTDQYSTEQTTMILNALPYQFKTAQVIEIAATYSMAERTVNDWLREQVRIETIIKIKQGHYHKNIPAESAESAENNTDNSNSAETAESATNDETEF